MTYRAALFFGLASVLSFSLAGCGLLLDSGVAEDSGTGGAPDAGAGMDGGRVDGSVGTDAARSDARPRPSDSGTPDTSELSRALRNCDALPDFTVCSTAGAQRQICQGNDCVASFCGDGITDAEGGEECDDGNLDDFDACDNDCRLGCLEESNCNDGRPCNGAERCEAHACVRGEVPMSGAVCDDVTGAEGTCTGLPSPYCHVLTGGSSCGNGTVDLGEQCDDGNDIWGDDCDPGCRYSCEADRDCVDWTAAAPEPCYPRICTASHVCREDTLSPDLACYADRDEDGFGAGDALMVCGTTCPEDTTPLHGDCDDEDPRVHPGTRLFYHRESVGGGWDFDCDGADQRLGGGRVFAGCTPTDAGCEGRGWEDAVPPCGTYAVYERCPDVAGCTAENFEIPVLCR